MRGDGLHRPGTKPGHAPTHALCLCQTMMSFIRALPANALRRRKSPPFTMSSPDPRQPAETARTGKAWKPCSFDHVVRSAKAWWSQTGSNRRPHACKARALPTELWPLFEAAPAWELVVDLSARGSHEVWWAQADSNCRPHAYQACALTN